MIAIGLLFIRMLCDFFKPRTRLEAEILILRHQLNVLQQRMPRGLCRLRSPLPGNGISRAEKKAPTRLPNHRSTALSVADIVKNERLSNAQDMWLLGHHFDGRQRYV
jgi:hypothetical protein